MIPKIMISQNVLSDELRTFFLLYSSDQDTSQNAESAGYTAPV